MTYNKTPTFCGCFVGMLDGEGDDKIPPEVEDIRKSMRFLFAKLDTLTHFHYTPKMQVRAFNLFYCLVSCKSIEPIKGKSGLFLPK